MRDLLLSRKMDELHHMEFDVANNLLLDNNITIRIFLISLWEPISQQVIIFLYHFPNYEYPSLFVH